MNHRHYAGDDPCLELSAEVCVSRQRVNRGPGFRSYTIRHERPDRTEEGYRCEGTVLVGPGCWSEEGSLEDGTLTFSPSVLCTGASGCGGRHGWVRGGRWVPA